MRNDEFETNFMKTKPKDWPVNAREAKLELIWDKIKEFEVNPSYKTREVLLAVVCDNDANQHSSIGTIRTTEFEVQLMNLIFVKADLLQIKSIKVYLYSLITETTRLQKISSWMDPIIGEENAEGFRIKAYEDILISSMSLYHFAYQKYTLEKTDDFPIQLISCVESILNESSKDEEIKLLANTFCGLLTDLSYMRGNKKEKLWEFSREDLYQLINLEARLFKICGIDMFKRPIKGLLKMQLSNYVLKSRNGYNEDYICKYISTEVATLSMKNHEIWMQKIEKLNDEREQRVIPELLDDCSWLEYSWAKDFDFNPTRVYFVSSFSKEYNNEEMKKNYGECVYGFKNDRIVDLIGPLGKSEFKKKISKGQKDTLILPFASQVIAFDVLYDKEEAKDELKYLFSLIELFDSSNEKKHSFVEELLQYWILSVKDFKWHTEHERRYVIFMYEDYEYLETLIDDDFLKIKTSLFLAPDFILGNNPAYKTIKSQVENKQKALKCNQYLHCKNCLMQDYDLATFQVPTECPICGSNKLEVISFN
ncbi:MAG: hypothetical protein RR063_09675 [Anaerovoracaceae bacterium]